jgi:O-antigen/teichoic acid export membrane protein
LGGFLSALFGIFTIRGSLSSSIDVVIGKKMLIFSLPLVLSSTAIHLSSFADRLIINDVLSLESLAVYGIAAKAASVITILLSGIQGALSPHFISTWNTAFGLKSLSRIFFIYLVISIFLLMFLKIFDKYILIFLGTSKALGGTKVLLILASASIVNGLNIFLFGLIKSLKTSLLSVIYLSTAALNIYLNYYLINLYGIEGAAFATLISASVGFLIHFYFSSKHLKLPFSFLIPFCFIIMILILNILMVA